MNVEGAIPACKPCVLHVGDLRASKPSYTTWWQTRRSGNIYKRHIDLSIRVQIKHLTLSAKPLDLPASWWMAFLSYSQLSSCRLPDGEDAEFSYCSFSPTPPVPEDGRNEHDRAVWLCSSRLPAGTYASTLSPTRLRQGGWQPNDQLQFSGLSSEASSTPRALRHPKRHPKGTRETAKKCFEALEAQWWPREGCTGTYHSLLELTTGSKKKLLNKLKGSWVPGFPRDALKKLCGIPRRPPKTTEKVDNALRQSPKNLREKAQS